MVKQFDPENLIDGFQQATDRLLSVILSESSFRRPVTVAIDITTIGYYGYVVGMPMVSGTKDGEGRSISLYVFDTVRPARYPNSSSDVSAIAYVAARRLTNCLLFF